MNAAPSERTRITGIVRLLTTVCVLAMGIFGAATFIPAATYIDTLEFLGPDSYYHALRVQAALSSGGDLMQFDPRSYVPSGSLVAWPWLYDSLLIALVRVAAWMSPQTDFRIILVLVPVAFLIINAGLIFLLARRLDLSDNLAKFAVALFCVSPNVHFLHGFGNIDHHFLELTFILLTIGSTIRWLSRSDSHVNAALCGCLLALAPAIQTGLLLLYLPFLLAMGVVWMQGGMQKFQLTPATFGLSLIVATVLLLLPSAPFSQGLFSYYWYSWFHFFSACGLAAAICLLARTRFSTRAVLMLGGMGAVCAALATEQLWGGLNYLAGQYPLYSGILEVKSMFALIRDGGWMSVMNLYTPMIMLLPLIALLLVADLRKDGSQRAFAIFALFGMALMLFQYRFNYFGYVALTVAPALLLRELSAKFGTKRLLVENIAAFAATVICLSSWSIHLAPKTLAISPEYAASRPIYDGIAERCNARPGTILSRWDDGHFLLYHTNCSVLANNMVVTPVQFEGAIRAMKLLEVDASQIRKQAPDVDYVFVHSSLLASQSASALRDSGKLKTLEAQLLGDDPPPGFEMLVEHRIPVFGGSSRVIARFFRVDGAEPQE